MREEKDFDLEMETNEKDVQDVYMGESDSQMDYKDDVKLKNKRVVTKLPMTMTTLGRKDEEEKDKAQRKETPQQIKIMLRRK